MSKVETPPLDPTVWDIILTEKRRESIMLAKMISAQLTESELTRNRGVKGAEFRVLMNTKVPALLLEVGFLTNPEEAKKLSDASYQTELVSVLTEGILGFLKEYEKTNGFTV
jgi:N-acetylmuramoyl-L-alanine amidase